MNSIIGFLITVILLGLFSIAMYLIGYEDAAIATTKGEYICQYNEFANDWDCKGVNDERD